MLQFLEKLLSDRNKRTLNSYQPVVDKINALEPDFKKLSDEALKAKTEEFKKRLNKGENLDDILPEAFAAVREAARRTIGERHFDVQLMGGIALHQGKIAEMKTGEGKTLVASLPLYLNSLEGKGAHLVTVNDYLSRVGAGWMGPIYSALGVSVSVIIHEQSFLYDPKVTEENVDERLRHFRPISRQEAYQADITYGTNNEFGFDYLRDNMIQTLSEQVQRPFNFAIVDEVDSILIDEARTPLIISAPAEKSAELYYKFARLVPNLEKDKDYNVDEKMQAVTLTDSGIKKMENMLGVKNIYEAGGISLVHHLEEALKAHALFQKDRDYVVKDGEIIIVDQFTGRLMPGRRWSEGLHQAIEAKEGVEIKRESVTLATISFQNLFRMYPKLAGMTGTAATESEEFYKIYGLDVVVIPTHKPMIRKDLSDRVYKTESGKFAAVVEEIKRRHEKGQPVLVGTIAIEKSEILSDMLKREGVPHEVLNAKQHEREARIIAQAGKVGAVTVATNMAGRGVDIILGGALDFKEKDDPKKRKEWEKEHEKVVKLGGLHVLGTERHEARRIDNQLRGRAGRQGDPGSSQFYVSMEDDLMRIFGGDRLKAIMTTLRVPEDQPIENKLISRSIESAQKKVEGHNFDLRKHLVEYDDVMNKHREVIYGKRRKILEAAEDAEKYSELRLEVLDLIQNEIEKIVQMHTLGQRADWNIKELLESFKAIFGEDFDEKLVSDSHTQEEMIKKITDFANELFGQREKSLGPEIFSRLLRAVYLRSIDTLWIEHLTIMEELREGIGLRGYGQRDPLVEYKAEAYQMFGRLQQAIANQVVHMIFRVEVTQAPPAAIGAMQAAGIQMRGADEQMAAGTFRGDARGAEPAISRPEAGVIGSAVAESEKGVRTTITERRPAGQPSRPSVPKVGRNEPCPCGSGKKYKKCCGR